MHRIPIGTVVGAFFRAGATIFGGGEPAMAMLQREFVERRKVLSPENYGVVFALARITPGTNMVAFCTGAGYVLSGWIGALAATAAVTVPPTVIAVVMVESFDRLSRIPAGASAIGAMVAAAVGLMAAASMQLLRPHLVAANLLRTLVIAVGSFLLIARHIASPVAVLGMAALIGCFWREPVEP
jgi:chromate transporter